MSDLLLSSTAERTYWLGRYLERAGNTARLVSVNASLMMDLPTRLPLGWLPLVDILALGDSFTELYGIPLDANGEDTYEREVVRFLLSDRRHGGSLMASLSAARENARTLRSSLPRAAFEHVNAAFLDAMSEPPWRRSLSRKRTTSRS